MGLSELVNAFKAGRRMLDKKSINVESTVSGFLITGPDSEYLFDKILDGKSSRLERAAFYTGLISKSPSGMYEAARELYGQRIKNKF